LGKFSLYLFFFVILVSSKLFSYHFGYRCISDAIYEDANNAHERALVFMHKVFVSLFLYI